MLWTMLFASSIQRGGASQMKMAWSTMFISWTTIGKQSFTKFGQRKVISEDGLLSRSSGAASRLCVSEIIQVARPTHRQDALATILSHGENNSTHCPDLISLVSVIVFVSINSCGMRSGGCFPKKCRSAKSRNLSQSSGKTSCLPVCT